MARRTLRAALILALALTAAGQATASAQTLTIPTDQLAGPPLMGLGVELDPYDNYKPTQADWERTFQRLDYMRPGFIRVVEPASSYFGGYDAQHNPVYNWSSKHVLELQIILAYAKSRGISVVLGDWSNPMINGDPRIPADFLQQLHDSYGYTNIRYYNLINEPNYVSGCDFGCWTGMVRTLSAEFGALGLTRWLQIVGPDNANSWDDTAIAQANDRTSGLDTDNPIGGDSWVTDTLQTIPGLIGAYDSHRYATIWGIKHGVYEDQMRARREQISNVDSPAKAYFENEVGLTARQVSPFASRDAHASMHSLEPLVDPSAHADASSFVDSQPHIRQFAYGVWMGDMVIQAIAGGVSGASAWDLDDAMHVGGQYGSDNLKQWGFWNSLGGQDGYPASDLHPRPWYYAWSVLARSFPAGSEPLAVPSTGVPGLRVAAVKIPAGGRYRLSLAIVNDSFTPRSITLTVPAARSGTTLARYDYFHGDDPVDANGFPTPVAVLHQVRLARGLTIQLASRGLVVLSSLGAGPAIGLHEGTRTLTDNLGSWSQTFAHSSGLRLAHSNPVRFDDDRSRAKATSKGVQYVEYRVGRITSFELKAYYQGALGLRVFRSAHGRIWTPISLASTNPAAALGGAGWNLAELFPGTALAPGTNRLKIEVVGPRTELGGVVIEHR